MEGGKGTKVHVQKEESIPAPKLRPIDKITVFEKKLLACGDGKFFHRTRGVWQNGNERFKTEDRIYDICVRDNKIVLSKKSTTNSAELLVFDPMAKTRTTIPLPISTDYPAILCGLPIDGQPTYYLIDRSENVVHQLDCEGRILNTHGRGLLKYPYSLGLDKDGDVMVTDWTLNDVIIFSRDRSVKLWMCKHNSLNTKQLYYPYGISVDAEGYIFVSSWRTNSVLLFSPSGEFIKIVLDEKDGLESPTNLTATPGGRLAVIHSHGTEIKKFKYRIS